MLLYVGYLSIQKHFAARAPLVTKALAPLQLQLPLPLGLLWQLLVPQPEQHSPLWGPEPSRDPAANTITAGLIFFPIRVQYLQTEFCIFFLCV